jgi:hypothetical protein
MGHLSAETLARIVDEAPLAGEAEHLAECGTCSRELQALKAQTEALRALPEILPPVGDWDVLEARLRSEGLIQDPGLLARLGLARTPGWMRAAAGVALFLGGAALGAGVATHGLPGTGEDAGAGARAAQLAENVNVQDAAEAVRSAEDEYVSALTRYREILAKNGDDAEAGDATNRYAALQYLVAASQAAVRQAPADPFLNGLLASTLAERQAVASRISKKDNWF